ncbi:uncharacterized protein [Haliotis asinina]|uniref:uncharacterized protein n=1 Tax=Haliotis asinina TaxID=109174 RepID=UPI0035318D0E
MFTMQQFRLMLVLILCFKEEVILGFSSAHATSPSTDAVDTPNNVEDSREDTSCVSCKRGFYGEGSCNRTCNQHCMLGYCNYSTGACKYGCVDTNRNSLTSPWHGPSCSQRCHGNCLLGRCFRNGTCYLGCSNGTYGDTCEDPCPENCFQNCKKKSGECEDGCQSGFYGKYCDMTCSVNCLGGRCHQNGKCHNCTEGFQGDTCYNKCPKHCKSCEQYGDNCTSCADGRYGHKCIVCDKCRKKCRFSDGKCTDGCKDGYHGDYCSVSCNIGCQPLVCDQSTGECSSGCIPTMYGTSCDQTCSSNCMENQCQNRSVLECSTGCIAGFWGKYCEHLCDKDCLRCTRSSGLCMECKRNTYGHHCEKNCSMNCFDRKCNNTGTCVSGCLSGYHGNNCLLKCSKRCSICGQKSGACSKCVAGWTGENCREPTKTGVFYTGVTMLMVTAVFLVCYLIYTSICFITRLLRKEEEGHVLHRCLKWLNKRRTITSADSFHSINKEFNLNSNFSHASNRLTLYDEKNNMLPCMTQTECLALEQFSNQRNDMKPYRLNNGIYTSGHQRCGTQGRTVSQCRLDYQHGSEVQHNDEISDCKETAGALLKQKVKTKDGRYRRSLSDGHETTHQSKTSIGSSRTGQTQNGFVPFNHTIDGDRSMPGPRFSVCYDNHLDRSETFRPTGGRQQVDETVTFEGEAKTPACGGQVGLILPTFDTTAVECRRFTEHVHRMRLHGGLKQQFEELPKGELATCVDAKRPVNFRQNRFRNMHPYDHCRVILPGSERASNYINASHINGYGKSRFYIATQGPLPGTTADFWDMVRHYEVTTIIMLTNIFENDRMKCAKYWPEVGQTHQYGGSCVQTVQEESGMDYTVRTMFISEEGERGHQICQYHYTAWPDHGQPSSGQSLLDFYYHAKATFGAGPVIVHCSAGIGRTGTFIALDCLVDQATAEGVVDVFQCVKKLRYQRVNMVQTSVQYAFLHDVLDLAFLELPVDHC